MRRIDGRRLGLWSLRIDAIYCTLLGAAVALGSAPISAVIALPQFLIAGPGGLVVLWAALVLWMLRALRLQTALRLVMSVNAVAALIVASCAAAATSTLAAVAVLSIAADVALFAVSQAVALRALASRQPV